MRNMLLGVVASGRRSSEPKEVTFTVVVGEATDLNSTFRGGGQLSGTINDINIGSLTPPTVLQGYAVKGAAAARTPSKVGVATAFGIDLEGALRPNNIIAQVQGLAVPITLIPPETPHFRTGWWWCRAELPDDALFNNWAPGVSRTVTLRWVS